MVPLVICSFVVWIVILERLWTYRRLGRDLRDFHIQAVTALLRKEQGALNSLCAKFAHVPTAQLTRFALDRLASEDDRIRSKWKDALERQRQLTNQDLRKTLWLLGTIGSAAPFIGLFGTVIGILQSFHAIARTGAGGFTVVASGISEALVATAAGIFVAVIAVMSYNAFQTRWGALTLMIRLHLEELAELLESHVSR